MPAFALSYFAPLLNVEARRAGMRPLVFGCLIMDDASAEPQIYGNADSARRRP